MSQPPLALSSYEDFGEEYAEVLKNNPYNAFFERPTTQSLVPNIKGKKVLDAGCGPGAYLDWLIHQKAQVTAVDVSSKMLELAQKKFSQKVRFYHHDLSESLSFAKDQEFDFILSSLTLHYLPEPERTLMEFYRILQIQGQVVFSVFHPFRPPRTEPKENFLEEEILSEVWDTIGRPVQVSFYKRSLSFWSNAIHQAGFVIEKISEGKFIPELQEKHPKEFVRLQQRPQFLFFKIVRL